MFKQRRVNDALDPERKEKKKEEDRFYKLKQSHVDKLTFSGP